jgi:hypothetical protein
MGRIERPRPIESVDPAAISRRAAQLFARASNEYPESASIQGAFYALQVRQLGISATHIQMGRTLLEDNPRVTNLVTTANLAHQSKGHTFVISEADVRKTISSGYAHAHVMDVLRDDDLEYLLEYYKLKTEQGLRGKVRESVCRGEVYDLINLRRQDQGLTIPVDQQFILPLANDIKGAEIDDS